MDIMLRIDGYQPPGSHEAYECWCDCGFSFCLEDRIHYAVEQDELLLMEEVDELALSFTELLEGILREPLEIRPMEPDFVFLLYPQKDHRQDICVEWRVYFWHEGLTDHYLTITLEREDIEAFRDFLNAVRGE